MPVILWYNNCVIAWSRSQASIWILSRSTTAR